MPQLRPICPTFWIEGHQKRCLHPQAWGIRGWNPGSGPRASLLTWTPKYYPAQLCRAGQGAWLRSFSGKSEGEGRDGEADLGL